ncbi:two-component system chemotaxis response regulator CheB [Deinococcus metalli]|uniref:protein-glutamate methylesterase n=1 Tax=Deinococcus metalli TaxID=1141878 RepID=A0A7W8NR82_9DEIO|nr:chemotaxis protein CheB [Deinococcus metalli]MBB5376608.1 two-component system chemotaxis response regulator CheB [Deinococcus metalli]GHF42810.1 chemotaxis protein-glutamate methylesterase [Deinococcus metalli]
MMNVVVIGGSAGALEPLLQVVSALPADGQAAVLVALHQTPDAAGYVPALLARSGGYPAAHAQDGEPLLPGRVYVAPPDHHLIVGAGRVEVRRGPKENGSRPSIDVLFRSAALAYGPDVTAVLLSGELDDGTAGLWAVKVFGGHALVQHPDDAASPAMPLNAVRSVPVDRILPVGALAEAVRHAASAPLEASMPDVDPEVRRSLELDVRIAGGTPALEAGVLRMGEAVALTCPQCHGALVGITEGRHVRFRCHTGHAYSAETLHAELRDATEARLWEALRALDEQRILLDMQARTFAAAREPEREFACRAEEEELAAWTPDLRDLIRALTEAAARRAQR